MLLESSRMNSRLGFTVWVVELYSGVGEITTGAAFAGSANADANKRPSNSASTNRRMAWPVFIADSVQGAFARETRLWTWRMAALVDDGLDIRHGALRPGHSHRDAVVGARARRAEVGARIGVEAGQVSRLPDPIRIAAR